MPHVVACAMNTNDVMHASCNTCTQASQPTQDIYDAPEVTYWHAICMSQMTSTKLTASHFHTLNNKIANENKLKRILIAMYK